jgi:hypothetical protein
MTTLVLHTRSFHPDANFGAGGLGFKGDNRGFSDSLGVTSRIYHFVTINLVSKSTTVVCRSDPSENEAIPAILTQGARAATGPAGQVLIPDLPPMSNDYTEARKQPRATLTAKISDYRVDGNQSVQIDLSYAGKNFAFYGANTDVGHTILGGAEGAHDPAPANDDRWFWQRYTGAVPDLDVTHKFYIFIDRTVRSAHVTSTISGDGFPNCESFMVDSASGKCFLGTHVRIGTAATQLPGGRALPMTNTMFQLDWQPGDKFGVGLHVQIANDYTGDGSPQEVAPFAQTNRTAWNNLHKARDASGGWLRQIEDNVPLPRQTLREIREGVRRIFE